MRRLEITNCDEQLLVRLVKIGDQEAVGELFQRNYRKCMARAMSLLKNRDDAEDEVQNAFCKVLEHIHQYRGEAEFSSWVLRIVSNQCLMLLRSRRRVRQMYLDEVFDGEKSTPAELPTTGPDPEGDLGSLEMAKVVHMELRRVPLLLRRAVVGSDLQELPMAQVAKDLGVTVAAAKSRLLRGRSELRVRLRTHFDGIGTVAPLSRTAVPFGRIARHSVA